MSSQTPKTNGTRRNHRSSQKMYKNAKEWPSSDHRVVKLEHAAPEPPFNVPEVVNAIGTYTKYCTQASNDGTFETKIEMKTANQAEKLWKYFKQQLQWDVISVDPDFFYTIKKHCNGQAQDVKMAKQKDCYQEYWSEEKVKEAVAKNKVIVGALRINSKKPTTAFISDSSGKDVMMPSREDRNRALDGDVVAVEVNPESEWLNLDGSENELSKLEGVVKKMHLNSEDKQEQSTSYATPLKRKTGKVVAIMEKVHSRIATGFIKLEDKNKKQSTMFLTPCNHSLPYVCIPREVVQREMDKQDISNVIFACRITQWDNDKFFPMGELCHIVGEKGQVEPETKRILVDCDVDEREFSQEVIDCLPLAGGQWSISDEERSKRRDFTKHCVFSIDPPHARDLDDALHCRRLPDGNYEVGVHIADVSHFVKPQTELDKWASSRATSVYLVQRVVPMLPRLLCEQLCSLNPDVERLAFSVVWTLTKEGEVKNEWFGRSVIRSCAKLSYDHAQMCIDGRHNDEDASFPPISDKFALTDIAEKIYDLFTISQNLRRKRMDGGALRLDQVRLSYTLETESGLPNGCYTYNYKKSNELIEEFMLLANMAVAHQLHKKMRSSAFLRCHPSPKEEMMDDMVSQCRSIGLEIDARNSKTLSESLRTACGDDELAKYRKMALFMLAIKPQKLAAYLCAGMFEDNDQFHHYALNVPLYTHFTSPIRRYADLVVHRQLAATLGDSSDVDLMQATAEDLEAQAKLCNHRKANAKTAGDLSVALFFSFFVKSFGPLYSPGMVMNIHDHSFDVLSIGYGITKRIYMDSLPLLSFQYGLEDSPLGNQKLSTMKIKWPFQLKSDATPVGKEPPKYETSGDGIEQKFEIFSQVDLVIKQDDTTSDGYKVFLKTPETVVTVE